MTARQAEIDRIVRDRIGQWKWTRPGARDVYLPQAILDRPATLQVFAREVCRQWRDEISMGTLDLGPDVSRETTAGGT